MENLMAQVYKVHTSDGVTLKGERIGKSNAPVLIFSHSLGCTLEMWREQANILMEDFDIVLMDTRGHGLSETSGGETSLQRLSLDVIETADALGIDTFHFCGLSLGGMVGQQLVQSHPFRLLSVILAATSSYMGPPIGWQKRIDLVLSEGMRAMIEGAKAKWFAPENFASKKDVDAAVGWLLGTDPRGYVECCAAIRDMDLRNIEDANNILGLIIAGKNDQATPSEHSELILKNMKNAQLVSLPGAHLLNLEQPKEFTHLMLEFYKRFSNR